METQFTVTPFLTPIVHGTYGFMLTGYAPLLMLYNAGNVLSWLPNLIELSP